MKKFARIIAAVMALMMAAFALPALAAPGDVTIHRDGQDDIQSSIRDMAYINGKLLMFTYDTTGYYIWDRATAQTSKVEYDPAVFERENGYVDFNGVIYDGTDLYALMFYYDTDEESGNSTFVETRLYKLAVDEALNITFPEEYVELDWDDMLESYDDYEYVRDVSNKFIRDGRLVFVTYGDNGRQIMSYDIESGECDEIDIDSVERIAPYKDGKGLVGIYDYENEDTPYTVMTFDFVTGETEELVSIPVTNYNTPNSLIYDANSDSLLYVMSGELMKQSVSGGEAEAVAAVQLDGYSDSLPILTDDGQYICGDYQTVIMRSTDPTQRAENSITVYSRYNNALENAYYTYSALNPDIEIVMTDNQGDIIQSMMSKSDAIDVYTVSVGSSEYKALYDRGYLAELGGSEKLSSLVGGMYDSIKDVCYKDGELVAVPVEMYCDSISINMYALKKMGFTEEDVPTSWMGFLKLLQKIPETVGEDSGLYAFDPYTTQADAKNQLFYGVLQAYMRYMTRQDVSEMSFDTELMHNLLAELEKVDFAALGLPEEYDEDFNWDSYDSENVLIQFYGNASCDYISTDEKAPVVMPLALDEGMDPEIACDLTVSVVNPYSQNRDAAIAYLEAAADNLDQSFLTNTSPDINEPILNQYFEENKKWYEEQIESIKSELEKASDDEKADWQVQLDETQKGYDEYVNNYAYSASEESIANYRKIAQYITVTRDLGMNSDANEEFYAQIQQYLEGTIDADTMLKGIDKKLKMMLMEGM